MSFSVLSLLQKKLLTAKTSETSIVLENKKLHISTQQ